MPHYVRRDGTHPHGPGTQSILESMGCGWGVRGAAVRVSGVWFLGTRKFGGVGTGVRTPRHGLARDAGGGMTPARPRINLKEWGVIVIIDD